MNKSIVAKIKMANDKLKEGKLSYVEFKKEKTYILETFVDAVVIDIYANLFIA